jgi:nucleotide-binding universal stress UspA family protein
MAERRHRFAGLVPEMLLRSIRNHRCVLFAGAGLSAQAQSQDGARLPTWGAMLDRMIDWCVEHRIQLRAEPAEFRDVISRGRLLAVAQELQESVGAQLNSCLSEILHSGKTKPSDAHRLVSKIDWVAALSSNYDGLIEGAYAVESSGIVPPVFSPDGISQALDCLRNDRFFVFKVHGDVNVPGSIVLSNRDYARMLYLSPGYRSFLETVFAAYTVLFVGFGGADPDLDGVVDRLSAIYERGIGQHFILISEEEFSALERRRLLEDKRLDCITYKRDASHSQVVEFLRALSELAAPDAKVEDPFAGDQRRPRVFLSGSHQQLRLLHEIKDVAELAGFDVWFAETQIAPGDPIADVIAKAIDEADLVIAVLSEILSDWVSFEISRALGAHKKVLPIRVGKARLPSDLPGRIYLQVEGPHLTDQDEARITSALKGLVARKTDS